MCFTWLGLSSLSYHRTQVRSLCTLVIAQSNAIFLCYAPILMYIYDIQYELMQKSHQNHSNKQNRWFYFVKLSSHKQAKKISNILFTRLSKTEITHLFNHVCHILTSTMWKSTAVAFQKCMGIIDVDDFWLTYGHPKLTLVSIFFGPKVGVKKINTPFVMDGSLQNE